MKHSFSLLLQFAGAKISIRTKNRLETIPALEGLHAPLITSHNIYYVKLDTLKLAPIHFFILFVM